MKFIETNYFKLQLKSLSSKYKKINEDYSKFKIEFNIQFATDLWWWIFKIRIWNSSIPVWKRWWFRIIVKILDNKILPLIIYSKTNKENISDNEIIKSIEKSLYEL